jgi:molecular chaperone HtpG
MNGQVLEFQAETSELLNLLVHSLYTSRDVFLRELISNSSDALDRLRFEGLTRHELVEEHRGPEIKIEADPKARTLTISDNGVGMSREELIANIGTIAKSGTRELRQKLAASSAEEVARLIGQFGVGFYSAFMVAERVKLVTRRAGEDTATSWESAGGAEYTVCSADRHECGTTITLSLKAPDADDGIEDYTSPWWLTKTIKKYSDFIQYPIIVDDGLGETPGETSLGAGEPPSRVVNAMKPIWKSAPTDVTDAQHEHFYRLISDDWSPPRKTVHFRAEGRFEYDALLYLPVKAPSDLYYVAPQIGLNLYANGVLIMERCADLLPTYLRFVRGVVDVGNLPLNVSRQRLQQDHHIAAIQKRLTRKILSVLSQMLDQERDAYGTFWTEFGRAVKEGVSSDFDNRDSVISLVLFQSSANPDALVTLQEYVARMKPDQTEIFYLTGETRAVLDQSPHLEVFRQRDYEVLYMTDPVDELVLQHLTEYDGKRLKSAAKGAVALGTEEERTTAEAALKEKAVGYEALMRHLQQSLDQHVKQVRLSSRLTDSPVCLVVEDHDYSPLLERMLNPKSGNVLRAKRILEINPDHAVIKRLRERVAEQPNDPFLSQSAQMLFGLGLMLEGSAIPDPIAFVRAALGTLDQAL